MKPLLFTIAAILLAACTHQSPDNNRASSTPQKKGENTQTKTADVSLTSSRGEDIIQTIYSQLLKDNPSLQNIENSMANIENVINDSTEAFKTYNNKSQAYYDAAHSYLLHISDTVLRSRLQQMVDKSMNAYTSKIASQTVLLKETDSVTATLHNVHTALKIAITLPAIENYQNANLPSTEPVKAVITKANNLVKQINSVKN